MQRPLHENTRHSQETDTPVPCGIWTRHPKTRAAAYPCLAATDIHGPPFTNSNSQAIVDYLFWKWRGCSGFGRSEEWARRPLKDTLCWFRRTHFLKMKRIRKNIINTCRPVYLQCTKCLLWPCVFKILLYPQMYSCKHRSRLPAVLSSSFATCSWNGKQLWVREVIRYS